VNRPSTSTRASLFRCPQCRNAHRVLIKSGFCSPGAHDHADLLTGFRIIQLAWPGFGGEQSGGALPGLRAGREPRSVGFDSSKASAKLTELLRDFPRQCTPDPGASTTRFTSQPRTRPVRCGSSRRTPRSRRSRNTAYGWTRTCQDSPPCPDPFRSLRPRSSRCRLADTLKIPLGIIPPVTDDAHSGRPNRYALRHRRLRKHRLCACPSLRPGRPGSYGSPTPADSARSANWLPPPARQSCRCSRESGLARSR